MSHKLKVASTSLAGCFGCHMSLLDIDERFLQLIDVIEFDRSPITDKKHLDHCHVGIIEGGLCNTDNVAVLKDFRAHCDLLVAMGACAITGGIPAMRNHFELQDCLNEVYLNGSGLEHPQIPLDAEIPLLLDQVQPIQEVVKIDYFLPGCPPSAEAIWTFLQALLRGEKIQLPYDALHYD